jgi:DNA-binding SARP family transcriptional activator
MQGKVVAVPRRRTRALLYFLASEPAPHGRDELIELCWPNLDPVKARRQLSDALSDLKRTLGDVLTSPDTNTVAWCGPSADIAILKSQLDVAARTSGRDAATRLITAADLYSGEFLAGFTLDGADAFAEWQEEKRTSVSFDITHALSRAAELLLNDGDSRGAIDAALRSLTIDNLREDNWRLLMEARAAGGDRDGAIRDYARCRDTLSRELGLAPAPETEEVRRRLTADPGSVGAAFVPSKRTRSNTGFPQSLRLLQGAPAMVGRERELGLLLSRWQRIDAEQSGVALVAGEPGIGKSRLAAEFAARAAAAGALVAATRCPNLGDPPPYGPIEEAIRSILPLLQPAALSSLAPEWLSWLGRIVPEIALGAPSPPSLPVEEERARLAEAIWRVLDVLSQEQPLLLVIDDLQWAHPTSIGLVHALVARPWRGMILGTYRDTEAETTATEALQRLVDDAGRNDLLLHLCLGPLSAEDSESLVREMLKAGDQNVKVRPRALAEVGEGHPLFVLELTRAVMENPSDPDLPETLTSTIRGRLARLTQQARRTIELIAVFGEPITPELVARASGLQATDDALIESIEELTARRLLQDSARKAELSIAHRLIGSVVYDSLSSARRRALHARAAAALDSSAWHEATQTELLIRHFRLAGEPVLAAEKAMQAAERAFSLAEVETSFQRYRTAGDLFARAGRHREAAAAYESAGDTSMVACGDAGSGGCYSKALEVTIAAGLERPLEARLYRKMAELQARWGYDPEDQCANAKIRIESAFKLTDPTETDELSRLYSARSFIRSDEGDPIGAESDAAEAIRLAAPESPAWLQAMDALGKTWLTIGRWEDGIRTCIERIPVATKLNLLVEINDAYYLAALGSLALGDTEQAQEFAQLAIETSKRGGIFARVKMSQVVLADALCMQKRWADAEEVANAYLSDPFHERFLVFNNMMMRMILADCVAHRGDWDRARELAKADEAQAYPKDADFIGIRIRVRERLRAHGLWNDSVEVRASLSQS